MKKIMIGAALAVAALAASAQTTGVYGEVAYGTIQAKNFGDAGMVRLTVGKELTPNIALEGQLGAGTSTNSLVGNLVGVKVDSMVGAFVKAKYDVTPQVEVFGKMGYARGNFTAHVGNMQVRAHDSDAAYAVGAKIALSKTSSIGVDYTQYGNDSSLSTTMASYQLKF